MALINCKECNKEVSDQSPVCINCGFSTIVKPKYSNTPIIVIFVIFLLIVCGITAYFIVPRIITKNESVILFEDYDFVSLYEKAEYDKFNSPASENGLGDTLIYFEGVISLFDVLEATDVEEIYIYIVDDYNGNRWLATSYEGVNIVDGALVRAFGSYQGVSGKYEDLPSIVLIRLQTETQLHNFKSNIPGYYMFELLEGFGESNILNVTSLEITANDVLDVFDDSDVNNFHTFDLNGKKVSTFTNEYSTIKIFLYYVENSNHLSSILIAVEEDANSRILELADKFYEEIEKIIPANILNAITKGTDVFGENRLFIITCEYGADFDFGKLIFKNNEVSKKDFFKSEERIKIYEELYKKAEYQELYNVVMNYIEGETPDSNDNAYLILEKLNTIIPIINQIEVHYDNFDNYSKIFYKGLTDVDFNYSIVPFVTTKNNERSVIIGFHNSDWIFFNKAELKLDNGEKISFNINSPSREVISGSNLRESIIISLRDDHLEKLKNFNGMVIRFIGKDKQLDRNLTIDEQNSFKIISVFDDMNFFSNLLFRWENV